MNAADLATSLMQDAFWSGLAALGFAMLFNVPRRLLPACVIFGALGHAVRALVMSLGMAIEPATLLAAVVVGMGGTLLASKLGVPAPIFTVTGTIPMVPGVFAYRAMIGVLSVVSVDAADGGTLLVEASTYAIKTALILAAIAVGIAFPTLLFQRPKPVV